MVILGLLLLGALNDEAMTEGSIGSPFWRIILGAGIVAIIFGVINIALVCVLAFLASGFFFCFRCLCLCLTPWVQNFIFRESDIGVTARHIRAHGAVAANQAANRKGSQHSFHLSGKASLPSFRSSESASSPPRAASGASRTGVRFPIKISSPINNANGEHAPKPPSTPNPNLAVPNLAHHPAMYSDRV